jgi:hypothetical protein
MRFRRRLLAWLVLALLSGISIPQITRASESLSERTLDNLVAFTRLVGYVRYFYPADVAVATDWDQFSTYYMTSIEDAASGQELAEELQTIFSPYAPEVRVFTSDARPSVEYASTLPEVSSPLYVTQWVHIPWRDPNGAGQVIPSERIRAEVVEGVVPQTLEFTPAVEYTDGQSVTLDLHQPGLPGMVDLGGGVSAAVPFAVFADSEGTLPHFEQPDAPWLADDYVPDTRSARLASIGITWAHFQHLYVYWDVLEAQNVDWNQALRDALSSASSSATELDFYFTLRRMTGLLNDGHTFVTPPPELGLGSSHILPLTWDVVENQVMIISTLPDAMLDLQIGDRVLAIDGRPVEPLLAEYDALTSPTRQYGTFRILRELSWGTDETPVMLTIQPFDGGAVRDVAVPRIPLDNIPDIVVFSQHREVRPSVVAELAPGVIYVDFTRLTLPLLNAAVPVLAQAESIVVDARGGPDPLGPDAFLRHLSEDALTTAPFLMPVITAPDHQQINFVDLSYRWGDPETPHFSANVAFIINGNGTVSYAETLLSMVEKHDLGILVGSPTAGANGERAILPLPGGYRVSWSSLLATNADGSPLFTFGITPDLPVERTVAGIVNGHDELLEAAFSAVGGNPDALNPVALDLDTTLRITLEPYADPLGRFTSVIPSGWLDVEADGNFTPDDSIYLGIGSASLSPEDFVAAFGENAGGELVFTQEYQTDTLTWSLYRVEFEADVFVALAAVAEVGDLVFFVTLQTPTEDYELVYSDAFLPALDHFNL